MAPSREIPRVVIAATASGVGKTTATVALIGAMRARGLKIAAFKCGPDYLDPTYHERAAGVPSHNLDGWMMNRDAVIATFARASADADFESLLRTSLQLLGSSAMQKSARASGGGD